MTQETRRRLESFVVAIMLGGGGGWGVVEYRMGHVEDQLRRIESRVAEIYCATVPSDVRAGCR